MFSINKQSIRIVLISLGSVLLVLAINFADNTSPQPTDHIMAEQEGKQPSAYLINSTFNLFDAKGNVSKLHATKAFFFEDQDAIEIIQPKFSSNTASNKTTSDKTTTSNIPSVTKGSMQLSAENGFYYPSDERLQLKGKVIAKQIDATKQIDTERVIWQLKTEKLNINNKSGILSSDEKVSLQKGPHQLEAHGFTASLHNKHIELLSNVRGTYVFE